MTNCQPEELISESNFWNKTNRLREIFFFILLALVQNPWGPSFFRRGV